MSRFAVSLMIMLVASSNAIAFAQATKPTGKGMERDVSSVNVSAESLKHTLVVPHLEQPIVPNQTVVYCGTFQLAWNSLVDFAQSPIQLSPEHSWIEILNRRALSAKDLDAESFVAVAGRAEDGILHKIRSELEVKFGAEGKAVPLSAPATGWVAFAFLAKDLEFRVAFERLKYPIALGGAKVTCFGIDQVDRGQENKRKAAEQVRVFDYEGENDFIVELVTKAQDDRLILAKIPPERTLGLTIQAVERRLKGSEPKDLPMLSELAIPVHDWQIRRFYTEFQGRRLVSRDARINGTIAIAEQMTRFKLTEKGVKLRSLGLLASGPGRRFVFDRPHLIMLRRKDASVPYFAMWVAHPEILMKHKQAERSDGSN
jgi:hypothetical protein